MKKKSVETVDTGLLARVEGHGDVYVKFSKEGVEDVNMRVIETARYFEAMLMGRLYKEVPVLASRICGICDYAHSLTAVAAMESALEVTPGEETLLMRELLALADNIYSHSLHLYLLALPDYYDFHDAIQMAPKQLDAIKRGMRLKEAGNYMASIIGGRATMNLSNVVGGFTRTPTKEEFNSILAKLRGVKDDAVATVGLFNEIAPPDIAVRQDAIYSSIYRRGDYPFVYPEGVATDKGDRMSQEEFSRRYTEKVLPYSRAKFGALDGKIITVGAMARYNISRQNLHRNVLALSQELALGDRFTDRFQNNLAQAIELMHCIQRATDILENLDLREIPRSRVVPKAGHAVAITEAPRGILMHQYDLDENGKVRFVNIVTPTSINVASIESDLRTILPNLRNKSDSDIASYIQMLIRACDPCFSCSAHTIKVKVERT